MPGSTPEQRVQDLVAYLFKGAPVNFNDAAWRYLVQQFIVTYWNREMNTFHVEQFKHMLMGELMRYRSYVEQIGNGLLAKIANGGFDIREELTRLIKEDKDRNGRTQDDSTATRTDAVDGETNLNVAKLDKATEEATAKQKTVDDIDDLTSGVSSGTEKGKSTLVGSENSHDLTKNTGTQTTDNTGTENRTGSVTGSTEGQTNSKTIGKDDSKATTETDREGRMLNSENPQSMVNASTTGLGTDVSWKYATKLDDNINHEKVTNSNDGNSTSTTTGDSETSTVQNSTDNLVLDTQSKMTDNRTTDTTGSRDRNDTTTTDNATTNDARTEYSRDATQNVEAESGSTTTVTGTNSETATRKEDRTQNESGTKSSTLTMDEITDRSEDVLRVMGKLTPLEGNTKIFQFFMDYMEEPVMRVVQRLDILFMSTYPDESRWSYLTWQERESCVAKL